MRIKITVAAGAQETVAGFGTTNYITIMQDMTTAVCHGARNGETGQLLDARDGSIYNVARLKDGNCWMTQNLKIIDKTISSADSDMASNSFTIPASDKSGFTISDRNNPKAYYDTEYGGYYNFYTATAGSSNASVTNDNTSSSICPKGWQLPVHGDITTDKSYNRLLSDISTGNALTTSPYYFVYGGAAGNDSLNSVGSIGFYWSSTPNGTDLAYYMHFDHNKIMASEDNGARYNGLSVRCVAR